jgi:hypothetical protein
VKFKVLLEFPFQAIWFVNLLVNLFIIDTKMGIWWKRGIYLLIGCADCEHGQLNVGELHV